MATIFIVDDEPMIHQLYKDVMKLVGHIVAGSAYDGDECISLIRQLETLPDYILMDHRMPKKNGLDATKELLAEFPSLRIIFVSADSSVRDDALKSGAKGFLTKPVDLFSFFGQLDKYN